MRKSVRLWAGKDEDPGAGIVDSQSVKTAEKGISGFDSGKKIKGRSGIQWLGFREDLCGQGNYYGSG